jgi:hypothetical protein
MHLVHVHVLVLEHGLLMRGRPYRGVIVMPPLVREGEILGTRRERARDSELLFRLGVEDVLGREWVVPGVIPERGGVFVAEHCSGTLIRAVLAIHWPAQGDIKPPRPAAASRGRAAAPV